MIFHDCVCLTHSSACLDCFLMIDHRLLRHVTIAGLVSGGDGLLDAGVDY